MSQTHSAYYVPQPSYWPLVGSIGLFILLGGFANYLVYHGSIGWMVAGAAIVIVMLFGWFGTVIRESLSGQYNEQVDRSFRYGMAWFIFSEVMFFAAFFGALFYMRVFAEPWLGGMGGKAVTHLLYPDYIAHWPSNGPGKVGGAFEHMNAWGIPAINTLILLSSGATVTWAHWGLKKNNRTQLILGLFLTVALGFLFVALQGFEYHHAYTEMNLTLKSGAYGTTFFMLTGFHGLHVTIGAIMLTTVLLRSAKGHFSPHHHFAFEAAAWYWHFVDVVWLGLFVFVYWLV